MRDETRRLEGIVGGDVHRNGRLATQVGRASNVDRQLEVGFDRGDLVVQLLGCPGNVPVAVVLRKAAKPPSLAIA